MREFIFLEVETSIPVKGKMLVPYGELVRCKDCKYGLLSNDGEKIACGSFCDMNGNPVNLSLDFFCAAGERMTK